MIIKYNLKWIVHFFSQEYSFYFYQKISLFIKKSFHRKYLYGIDSLYQIYT